MTTSSIKPFLQVDLHQSRETKNMVLFEADPTDKDATRRANVPNVYIRQTALASAFSKFPAKIRVTIEEI